MPIKSQAVMRQDPALHSTPLRTRRHSCRVHVALSFTSPLRPACLPLVVVDAHHPNSAALLVPDGWNPFLFQIPPPPPIEKWTPPAWPSWPPPPPHTRRGQQSPSSEQSRMSTGAEHPGKEISPTVVVSSLTE
jgi:hypothetical protein